MKHTLFFLGAAFIILLLATAASATNDLTGIYGGVVQYDNPEYDSVAMLDFTYSVERRQFAFYHPDSTDKRFYARIFAQVDLIDSRGLVVDSASSLFSTSAMTLSDADKAGVRLFDRIQMFAKPGLYSARITVIDAASKRKGEVFIDKIVVEPAVANRIRIGGVCLAYRVRYVGNDARDVNPRLVRNGYEIIPNPLAVYSVADSTLAMYSEIYNLTDSTVTDSDPLQIFYAVVGQDSAVVRPLGMQPLGRPGRSAAIAENLDIKGLPADNYKVRLIVVDPERNQVDTQFTAFSIMSPRSVQSSQPGLAGNDPYDTLSFKAKVRLVTYILTPAERQTFESLNDSGKVNYLTQYWKEHNGSPNSKGNATRREMLRRYNFVNALFSNNMAMDNGWSTDRGRIYMTYGPWDERNQYPAPRTGNPFEIWHYRSMKEGKVFVFEDISNTEDYKLVHSNVDGEVFNQAWQDRIELEGLDVF